MKKRIKGFTLIELVIFIVITAIIAIAAIYASRTSLLSAATTSNQITANLIAQQCMEWLLGNRIYNGYNTYSCPSTPTPTLCSSPANYTVSASVACTTLGSDTNFKTLTVVVSGNGNITLKTLIANY